MGKVKKKDDWKVSSCKPKGIINQKDNVNKANPRGTASPGSSHPVQKGQLALNSSPNHHVGMKVHFTKQFNFSREARSSNI